jgi:hypothetical protein
MPRQKKGEKEGEGREKGGRREGEVRREKEDEGRGRWIVVIGRPFV